ncbi:hypothetical protein [Anoxynatronum buryatiense]|uniref:Uncharacterized protein n=1 Tax=Anoxynatronum buryatiense TaxID=489973 RepID=A0AA45WVZ2_9CLOT|nr:hypothetical protein [Anoxynatronum buryatiense]SMP51339.1 hypothetical protein SAMN06296020_10485 [Anoxynatronum buryatiense]
MNDNLKSNTVKKTYTIIEMIINVLKGCVSLLGLLMITAVIGGVFSQMKDNHPVILTAGLLLFVAALYLGSQKRRSALLHVIHQVFRIERLMMLEETESLMLEERDRIAGETKSLDDWR